MNAVIRLFYRAAPVLAVVFTVLAALFFLQKETGYPLRQEASLSFDRTIKTSGHGIRASIEGSSRTPQAEVRATLLRNGEPFGIPTTSNRDVKDHGGGRYNVRGHIIWFSGPAGVAPESIADSSSAEAVYTVLVPLRVRGTWPTFFLVVALGCALAGRRTTFIGRPPTAMRATPFWLPSLLGVLAALIVTFFGYQEINNNPYFTHGAFAAKSIPYSDAQGWDLMARNLSQGHGYIGGFGAQRPFYSVALASAYTHFGETISTGQGLNLVILGLLVAITFTLSYRAFRTTTAAIVITLFFSVSAVHQEFLHLLLTEEFATMLGLASLATFWAASVSAGHTSATRPELRTTLLYVAAGLLFGFSNLSRPFTLLAAPLLALVALLAQYHHQKGIRDWRWFQRGLWDAGALALGSSAVVLPWIIRQRFVHGITSISDASGTLLYAAAKGRPWGPQDVEELIASGAQTVAEKNQFYTDALKSTVAADPGAYIHILLGHLRDFPSAAFDLTLPQAAALASFAVVAASIGAAWRSRMLLPGIVSFVILWPLIERITALPVAVLLLIAIALTYWRARRPERLLLSAMIASLVGAAFLCAIIGNFGMNRLAGLRDIFQILILTNGLRHLATLIADVTHYMLGRERLRPPIEIIPKFFALPYLPFAALALSLAACATILPKTFNPAIPPAAETLLSESQRAEALAFAQKTFPSATAENTDIRVLDFNDRLAPFEPLEDIGHYAHPFQPGDKMRTVAVPRDPAIPGPLPVVFQETLPKDVPQSGRYILVSVPVTSETANLGFDPTLYHALTLAPLDGSAPPKTFSLPKEAQDALDPGNPPEN